MEKILKQIKEKKDLYQINGINFSEIDGKNGLEAIALQRWEVLKETATKFIPNFQFDLSYAMQIQGQTLFIARRIEQPYSDELIRFVSEFIMEHYNVSDDDVYVDASLEMPSMDNFASKNVKKRGESQRLNGNNYNDDDDDDENGGEPIIYQNTVNSVTLKNEINKRHLINALIQGIACKGEYLFYLIQDELKEIVKNDEIIELYHNHMVSSDIVLWELTPSLEQAFVSPDNQGCVSGKNTIKLPEVNKVKFQEINEKGEIEEVEEEEVGRTGIEVQAMITPIMCHEIVKGIFEMIAMYHGQSKDREITMKVIDECDTLENEIWALRIGPQIWTNIYSQFPDELIFNTTEVFMDLVQLPADVFIETIEKSVNPENKALEFIFEKTMKRLREKDIPDYI
jgi:hypothetical protein